MRAQGLATAERVGNELRYRANGKHRSAALLRQLVADSEEHSTKVADDRAQDGVRSALSTLGAPLASLAARPLEAPLEQVVAEGLALSHHDATVARVLPLVLWKNRGLLDYERLAMEATRRDEAAALGCFLELSGRLGGDARLVAEAKRLVDKRRSKRRMFFAGPHGPRAVRAARRNTPPEALRWGFVMNMGRDSFETMFEKFAER